MEFKWKVRNQSKCWNLGVKGLRGDWSNCSNLNAKCQVDQNVEIWVIRGPRLIKMLKFEWKGESMETFKFEDKAGN